MGREERKHRQLEELIKILKKAAIENRAPIWRKIAKELERPSRLRRGVNIFKIEKYSKEGETVVVPGKVLGVGELSKKVKVVAFRFSEKAKKKILEKGEIKDFKELIKENPKGSGVKIIV